MRTTTRRRLTSSLLAAGVAGALGCAGAAGASAAHTGKRPSHATRHATSSGGYSDLPKPPLNYHAPANDGLGVKPGAIKHVWMIVLENKAYDASFTGLNDNTYLWQTLPSQGALLQNYYGTGHSSQDNYIALTSGQAPVTDIQDDCPAYTAMTGRVDRSGTVQSNPNFGQFVSAAGANAPSGQNGCVYPKAVPTLFGQLDAAQVPWKVYAQDLGNPDTNDSPHDAGTQHCGADDATVGPHGAGSDMYPVHGTANETDQYVAYHNPLPWYESVLQSGDCDEQHLASMFSSVNGLYHDLQHDSTTPSFNLLLPNDCSDGHDAVCKGNNLSGGWSDPTTAAAPLNYTGGLYAADLYLEHVIPEIEASPAFRDGGLIDITFDEAYPQFTYSNSRANSRLYAPTAATDLGDDVAGETLWGLSVPYEPTGPNVPNVTAPNGQALSAGPGFNEGLDRPSAATVAGTNMIPCTSTGIVAKGQCYLGGGGTVPGPRTDTATAPAAAATIADNAANLPDEGRSVSGAGIPAGAYVGTVTDTPVSATKEANRGGVSHTGSFRLVDAGGAPLRTIGAVTSVTLGGQTPASDPHYDAYDPTTGGGDTGDLMISPYITPGTVSTRQYNHYATLRTLEDIFQVAPAAPGLDGEGHLGYADQPGLATFGPDVFTDPSGRHANSGGYSLASLTGAR